MDAPYVRVILANRDISRPGVARRSVFQWKNDAKRGLCSIPQAALRSADEVCDAKLATLRRLAHELREDIALDDLSPISDTKRVPLD
jgi:hypothetical protein